MQVYGANANTELGWSMGSQLQLENTIKQELKEDSGPGCRVLKISPLQMTLFPKQGSAFSYDSYFKYFYSLK